MGVERGLKESLGDDEGGGAVETQLITDRPPDCAA